jgi:hypothetical protein
MLRHNEIKCMCTMLRQNTATTLKRVCKYTMYIDSYNSATMFRRVFVIMLIMYNDILILIVHLLVDCILFPIMCSQHDDDL